MDKSAGVWIDSQRAVIVSLDGNQTSIMTINSNSSSVISDHERGKFGDQDVSNEKSEENKQRNQMQVFFKNVIVALSNAKRLVIFGPAQTKNEFRKVVDQDLNLKSIPCDVETADSMTDNQMIAWVKDFYKL